MVIIAKIISKILEPWINHDIQVNSQLLKIGVCKKYIQKK